MALMAYLPTKPLRGGAFGALSLEEGWVKKEDKPSDKPSTLRREWEIMCLLQNTGLVPEVDTRFGGTYFKQKYVPSNTLNDIVREYLRGYLPATSMKQVLNCVKSTLEEFYSSGWIHNDLHAANILLSLAGRGEWKCYIIDVAFATSEVAPPSEDMLNGVYFSLGKKRTRANDITRLKNFLNKRFPASKGDKLLEKFFSSL
jgi:serine/threonine protein kinase